MPMVLSNGPESVTVNRHPQIVSLPNDRSHSWINFTCLYCHHQFTYNPHASREHNHEKCQNEEDKHFYLISNPNAMAPNVYVCNKRPNIEQIKNESYQETYVIKSKPLVY